MIMSVHDPITRKRNMGDAHTTDLKRQRVDMDSSEAFHDTVYTVFVKSAMESLEKVCVRFALQKRQSSTNRFRMIIYK